MTTRTDFPHFDDPDIELVHLAVHAAAAHDAADEIAAAGVVDLAKFGWPPQLVAATWLVGIDDPIVATYSQWSTRPAPATAPFGLPTADGLWLHRERTQRDQATRQRPGCVIVARITFGGSAPDQAQAWIDTAFATDFGEDDPIDGLLAAHFHASDDGTNMVNLAEWRSADDHRRMMSAAAEAAAAGADDPAEEIHTFSGIVATAVDRFRIAHHLVPVGRSAGGAAQDL